MKEKKNYVRKKYFINKRLQGRYMFSFYMLVAIVVVVFSAVIAYYTSQTMIITYENYDLQLGSTPFMLFRKILAAACLLIILLGVLVARIAMYQTHRIAGPLYKFEQVLDRMSQGHLDDEVRIRENDDAQEILVKIKAVNRFLIDKVTALNQEVGRMEAGDVGGSAPEVASALAEMKEILAGFKISEEANTVGQAQKSDQV
ncbi:MAG: methyl-accepting chemotaxis protein [Proteobacteria bacterium]|nr:methyl-accepting chemotaxis protein [Pseudomonadota bacterium]MBU1688214.1 methyl-accepting chemotaxis protein [Pseudomonadota bacterium]